ncbi:MAG: CBS domain-containing protein [Flavobacteriales bacterium]|nr:CBS domain-containing protein [Flavobacteriales bacterium]
MKISASIYSDSKRPLPEVVRDIHENQVDFFHVDCNDELKVFEDIKVIRGISDKPVDLHIITAEPEKYYAGIVEEQVEYVTFQYEDLSNGLDVPQDFKGELGLAITSETDISVFDKYADRFSFILFMATTPGQSSGVFNKENFQKIRQFRKKYPGKRIHVDGGVNGEVSFILRNMGVYAAVSGSYLFNANQIGSALLDLKSNEMESHYQVKDFMRGLEETPTLGPDKRSFQEVLQSIEDYKLAFTLLVDANNELEGLVSNADVRKGLLNHMDDLNNIEVEAIVNRAPAVISEDTTVVGMLKHIKSFNFPINYLPVVNDSNQVTGVITFINLIKGEL